MGNIFLDLTELFVSLHTGINLRISGNGDTNLLQTEQAELQANFAQLMKKKSNYLFTEGVFQNITQKHVSVRLTVASFHEMNNDCINGGLTHLKVSMC